MLPVPVIAPGKQTQIKRACAERCHSPQAIVDLMHRAKALVRRRVRQPATLAVIQARQHRRAGRRGQQAVFQHTAGKRHVMQKDDGVVARSAATLAEAVERLADRLDATPACEARSKRDRPGYPAQCQRQPAWSTDRRGRRDTSRAVHARPVWPSTRRRCRPTSLPVNALSAYLDQLSQITMRRLLQHQQRLTRAALPREALYIGKTG